MSIEIMMLYAIVYTLIGVITLAFVLMGILAMVKLIQLFIGELWCPVIQDLWGRPDTWHMRAKDRADKDRLVEGGE